MWRTCYKKQHIVPPEEYRRKSIIPLFFQFLFFGFSDRHVFVDFLVQISEKSSRYFQYLVTAWVQFMEKVWALKSHFFRSIPKNNSQESRRYFLMRKIIF